MSGNRRDVNLVIRAKDEASRAFEQATTVLEQLVGINNRVGSSANAAGADLAKLGEIALTLDRVFAKVNTSADSASASFARQQKAIADQRAQLGALQAQAQNAAAAMERLNGADAVVSAGRDQAGRIAQLKQVTAEYDRLKLAIDKLKTSIAISETDLAGQTSSLQRIGSTANAVEAARQSLTTTIERETRALQEQARAASVLEAIERSTGIKRDNDTEYLALTEQIRRTSEARDIEITKMKAEELASASLSRAKQKELDLNSRLDNGTKSRTVQFTDSPVKSAKDSASVFQAAEANGLQNLAKAMGDATRAAQEEANAVAKLRAEVDPLGVAQAKLNADLAAARALYDRSAITLDQYTAKVTKLNREFDALKRSQNKLDPKQVDNLAKALGEAARAAADEADDIARLKGELAPLAAAEAAAAIQAEKLKRWLDSGRISAKEYDGAIKVLNADLTRLKNAQSGIDSRGRPSLFGLKPYEAQNFAFQINDIITQLASGTSLSQTLAQQGGQLIQLFPRVGSAIIGAFQSGPILAFIATVGVLVAAIKAAGDEAERLRKFDGILASNADGASHSAAALAETARALDKYGLSAEEALKVTQILLREGFDDSQILQLGEASKNLADVLGIDVADAARQVANAFHGGFDAIKKLDDATNFLTATERAHIKQLFLEAKAQEARTEALRIFESKMDTAANKMRGEWAGATRELGNAWQDFMDLLADTGVIDAISRGLRGVGEEVQELIKRLRGLEDLQSVDRQIEAVRERQSDRANGDFLTGVLDTVGTVVGQNSAAEDNEELNGLLRQREQILGRIAESQTANAKQTREVTQQQQKQNEDLESATDQLKLQGDKLSDNQRVQLTYNEALLEAIELYPDATADLQIQYAKTKAMIEQTRLEKIRRQEAERAADAAKREREERERLARDSVHQTKLLLAGPNLNGRGGGFEGFTSRAKWDVNAFRAGFGSDTVTRQDGRIDRVTKNTTVTLEEAMRDLERRIGEFQKVVKEQIGTDRFNSFSATQQAALTSIAYNYGSLPDRIMDAVRTGTNEEIAAAVRGLAGDNGGVNSARRNKEADILGQPNLAVVADSQRQLDDLKKKQDEYKQKIDEAVGAREIENEFLKQQVGLTGDNLLAKQREQYVVQETLKAQADADKLDILRDDPEWVALIARVKEAAGAYFDLSKAKEKAANARSAVEQPVQDLTAQRDALQEQIAFFEDRGQFDMAERLNPQLDAINAKLSTAIQKLIEFWRAVMAGANGGAAAFGMTNDQIQAMITGLETAGLSTQKLTTFMGLSATQIAESFANNGVQAINQFAQAIANGEGVLKSLGRAFRTFAAQMLLDLANMILKAILFKAIMSALGMGGVGVPVAHGGGVIGKVGRERNVSPAWFTTAVRYHSGGVAGLRPNEVPAILERGEEVVTEADPRHRKNLGKGGGASGGDPMERIKIVNAFDTADLLSEALGSAKGERALLNWVRNNRSGFKSAMGGG